MCGRFTLYAPAAEVAEVFELPEPPAVLTPRYNIAPTQKVPVVALGAAGRKLSMLKWGLVPSW
ncbi:MAG TPA: SOS response-associated peptidase family protein, partial [Urbifossiella sp.]|nr:SOS response-associated peptidase family protein [Urbifossiella sp.]